MENKKPFILSIVGLSDSGKTTTILKLLPELKKKGYRIAVAKHCPSGFDLDMEGKDSWKFSQAGSEGTFLSSSASEAIIRPSLSLSNMRERLKKYFSDFDLVLIEGYNNEVGIKKMQIIRKSVGGTIGGSDEIIAYVSDIDFSAHRPVYKLDDIKGIVSFIEEHIGKQS